MTADESRDSPSPHRPDAGQTQPSPEPVPGLPAWMATARTQVLDFYTEHYSQVVRFVMISRPATPHTAAEDAAQEAFIEAWHTAHRPGAWARVNNRQAWIREIALRCHDRPRHTRRRQPLTIPGAESLTDRPCPQPDPAELTTGTIRVLEALRSIGDDQACAVMAFTLDGHSDREIADQMSLDLQRVRNLRAKARKRLRQRLASDRAQEGGTAR